jgi:hypothetical protein
MWIDLDADRPASTSRAGTLAKSLQLVSVEHHILGTHHP